MKVWIFRGAFLAALVLATTMALLPHPPELLPPSWSDKAKHMIAFATLAILAAGAFPRARLARIGERLSFVGALIEVLQAIPSLHRDCDIKDWIADTLAIAIALLLVAAWRRHRGVGLTYR